MFEELLGCTADKLYEKAQPLAETLSSEEMAGNGSAPLYEPLSCNACFQPVAPSEENV